MNEREKTQQDIARFLEIDPSWLDHLFDQRPKMNQNEESFSTESGARKRVEELRATDHIAAYHRETSLDLSGPENVYIVEWI